MPDKHDETPKVPDPAPFAVWLREQSGGRLHEELSEKFRELVAAVVETGKPGTLALTVKVGPFRGERDTLLVEDRVTAKIPQHDRKTTIWFPDDGGQLHRNDPRQASFDFTRTSITED